MEHLPEPTGRFKFEDAFDEKLLMNSDIVKRNQENYEALKKKLFGSPEKVAIVRICKKHDPARSELDSEYIGARREELHPYPEIQIVKAIITTSDDSSALYAFTHNITDSDWVVGSRNKILDGTDAERKPLHTISEKDMRNFIGKGSRLLMFLKLTGLIGMLRKLGICLSNLTSYSSDKMLAAKKLLISLFSTLLSLFGIFRYFVKVNQLDLSDLLAAMKTNTFSAAFLACVAIAVSLWPIWIGYLYRRHGFIKILHWLAKEHPLVFVVDDVSPPFWIICLVRYFASHKFRNNVFFVGHDNPKALGVKKILAHDTFLNWGTCCLAQLLRTAENTMWNLNWIEKAMAGKEAGFPYPVLDHNGDERYIEPFLSLEKESDMIWVDSFDRIYALMHIANIVSPFTWSTCRIFLDGSSSSIFCMEKMHPIGNTIYIIECVLDRSEKLLNNLLRQIGAWYKNNSGSYGGKLRIRVIVLCVSAEDYDSDKLAFELFKLKPSKLHEYILTILGTLTRADINEFDYEYKIEKTRNSLDGKYKNELKKQSQSTSGEREKARILGLPGITEETGII